MEQSAPRIFGDVLMDRSQEFRELSRTIKCLPELEDLIGFRGNGWIDYDVAEGSVRGQNLLTLISAPGLGGISIQRAIFTAGSKIAEHSHPDCREWLIVYRGNLRLVRMGVEHDISVGNYACLAPGEAHWAVAVEDTEIIGITIPENKGYPDG